MDQDTIDPTIKNLVSAIGKAETGGEQDPYNSKGASGEFGRYQFMPDTWKQWTTEQGVDPSDTSVEAQNKVAYNKVKQWKDQGLNPAEIASKWNSGDENAYKTQKPGVNAEGVAYDTPGYTAKVSNYYKELSNGSSTQTPTSTTPSGIPGTTPTTPTQTSDTQTSDQPQSKEDWLDKSAHIFNAIFPGKQIGDAIGTLIAKNNAKPEEEKYITDGPKAVQILADIAQSALMVGGIPGIGAASSALGRVGIAGAESAAFGGLNAVAGGSTDPGEIAKQAAIGGTIGAATGGLLEGGSKVISAIRGKTAEEIAQVAEKDVSKLPLREQSEWYKQNAKATTETATNLTNKAKDLGEQSTKLVTNEINDLNQKIGTSSRETAINLKEPAQQVMRDASKEYVALTGEAADGSNALDKTITQEDLSSKIDSKFEHDPELKQAIKNDLGIKEPVQKVGEDGLPIIEATPEVKKITNQEILDKARSIMQTVSKTARTGGKVYSAAEYQAMQKYSFLMETLGDNGVDMKAANQFWKNYVPVRDKIVSQIKPFDEGNIKGTPFAKTLQTAEGTANTARQVASKLDAQNFVDELENRMKLPKGSIGADIRGKLRTVENLKLTKGTLEQIQEKALAQIKTDKIEALKKISAKQYNIEKVARTRKIIRNIIFTTLGLGTVGTEVGKAVLHTATGL